MKRYKLIVILLIVSAMVIVSWSFYGKKSLEHIKQHATLVKGDAQTISFCSSTIGRYGYE